MIGPLSHFPFSINVISDEKWASIPEDLRRIMLEEAARSELEALRVAAEHNEIGLQRNIDAGMELIEFSPEIRSLSFDVSRQHVIPGWLRLLGYPGAGDEAVDVFNRKAGPLVGLEIVLDLGIEDGFEILKVPITQGPYAGQTVSEALAK